MYIYIYIYNIYIDTIYIYIYYIIYIVSIYLYIYIPLFHASTMLNPHGCWLNCLRLITLNRPFEPSSPKSSGDGTQSPPGALEPVGGFNPSVGWFFPSEWKNKTCSKPPTSRWVMLGKSMVILFWLNIFYMQRKTLTQLTWFICFFFTRMVFHFSWCDSMKETVATLMWWIDAHATSSLVHFCATLPRMPLEARPMNHEGLAVVLQWSNSGLTIQNWKASEKKSTWQTRHNPSVLRKFATPRARCAPSMRRRRSPSYN